MGSRRQEQSPKSNHLVVPRKQRALVLQGGGALGAYEVGVIKKLSEELTHADKGSRIKDSKRGEDKLLFDIVAGTSIGAMNAAVLVSNVVKEKGSWKLAINQLEDFWTKGLASNPKVFNPDAPENTLQLDASKLPWWQPWSEKWQQNKNMKNIASEEAARRYYSTKLLQALGAEHIYFHPTVRHDYKFFDPDNKWYIYNNIPLIETIGNFATFPIATAYEENQPRLLITSVDIAEGKTITFDSYEKADGIRKTEYYLENNKIKGGRNNKKKAKLVTLRYDEGIKLEHVMASGTLPGIYDPKEIGNRKFWDGGILSNTPFRELLQSHRDYWVNVEGQEKAPDLDVYIVNVHTPTIPIDAVPKYYDEVQDRNNDIIFGDRSSGYDQYTANLITDYIDFINNLKKLAVSHIKDEKEIHKFEYEFEKLKSKDAKSTFLKNNREHQKYRDLLKGRFELTKIERIERKHSQESTSRKTADFSPETIKALIKDGENDVQELL
jgi:NTE family protein